MPEQSRDAPPRRRDSAGAPGSLTLAEARRFSLNKMAEIQSTLTEVGWDSLETVFMAGSLGRLEAHPDSDFDCAIIARSGGPHSQLERQVNALFRALSQCALKLPKADGIYRQPTSVEALLDPAMRGALGEEPAVFGKRMQCLLDARPVLHVDRFQSLRRKILRWYVGGHENSAGNFDFGLLLDDLCRYRHAYRAWQMFKFEHSETDSWALRQAKLGGSRVLTFAGLLFLLGASTAQSDPWTWVETRLDLTPLERLEETMCPVSPARFARVAQASECIHRELSSAFRRGRLLREGPTSAETLGRWDTAAGTDLLEALEIVRAELTAFLLEQASRWDPRFFSRLII